MKEHQPRTRETTIRWRKRTQLLPRGKKQSYNQKSWRTKAFSGSVRTTLILYSLHQRKRSCTSHHFQLMVKTWLLRMVVVENGVCGDSLVLRTPLKLKTSRGSSPCSVSSRSLAILISTPTWCGSGMS
jgi:hypothetical protein